MGLFKSLFGKQNTVVENETSTMSWVPLESLEQLDELEKRSMTRTQLVFKHSTSCGISRMVLQSFKAGYDFTAEQFDFYYLDLHRYREVSNEIADRMKVRHQSPQLLVIRNGVSVADASHGAIGDVALDRYL